MTFLASSYARGSEAYLSADGTMLSFVGNGSFPYCTEVDVTHQVHQVAGALERFAKVSENGPAHIFALAHSDLFIAVHGNGVRVTHIQGGRHIEVDLSDVEARRLADYLRGAR